MNEFKIAIVAGIVLLVTVVADTKKSINSEQEEQINFCSSELAKSVKSYNLKKCLQEMK